MSRVEEQLGSYLKQKYLLDEVSGTEVVVTLMAMVKDGRINEDNMRNVLYVVFNYNYEGIIRSISKASEILDDNLLNDIVTDVHKALT